MIHVGDCLLVMPTLDASSIDAIVTDPPYGLGFMGKDWDHGVPGEHFWREALRVAKPGAHLVAFGGTRTYHRLTCSIEDAGWEIRDCLMWVYGSGFPKSRNLDGDWKGWGTALKPAWEPIILARKPLQGTVAANVLKHGAGAMNIDGCRVGGGEEKTIKNYRNGVDCTSLNGSQAGRSYETRQTSEGRWPANVVHDGSDEVVSAFPESNGQQGDLVGHSKNRESKHCYGDMKAAHNALARGDSGSAARFFYTAKADREDRNWGCDALPARSSGMLSNTSGQHITRRDGGAPPPAPNNHPTVKPHDLMRWLCRLVTPPQGLVLDPFCGSGSTGRAALAEGFRFVGIELDPHYAAIAEARIKATQPGLPFGEVA